MKALALWLSGLAAVLGLTRAWFAAEAIFSRVNYTRPTESDALNIHVFSYVSLAQMIIGAVFFFAVAVFMWRLRGRIDEIGRAP